MRTLFARFLLWFWLALAVMLGAEIALETASLREGLGLHPEGASGRFAFHADLARETLGRSGPTGLDSLLRRFEAHGDLADNEEIEPHRRQRGHHTKQVKCKPLQNIHANLH